MTKFNKIDHIGIAVPNLDEAVKIYTTLLGKKPEHRENIEEQKVKVAFFAIDDTHLELLQSTASDGPIGSRVGLHHICLEVDEIETALAAYKAAGIQLIDEKPRIGAHGKKIAFVHPKSTGGVLIEISQTI